jgi:hypothetical protein
MQSKDPQFPIRIGRVSIEKYKGEYLRLRFSLDNVPYQIPFGSYSLERLEAAKNKAREIESDIYKERFDSSLEKYRLKPKPPTPINASVAPVQQEWDIKHVWEFYCKINENESSNATKGKIWTTVDKMMILGAKCLGLNQTFEFVVAAKSHYSDSTIDKALKLLRSACNTAIEAKKIADNPYTDKVWNLLDLPASRGDKRVKS